MNLYSIDEKLFNLIENAVDVETGELYETQEELDKAIDECGIELEKKIENIGCFIKNLEADVKALKEEENNLQKLEWDAKRFLTKNNYLIQTDAIKSNVRDYATINELTVLSNLETHNAQMIREEKSKEERFQILKEIADYQMQILSAADKIVYLEEK